MKWHQQKCQLLRASNSAANRTIGFESNGVMCFTGSSLFTLTSALTGRLCNMLWCVDKFRTHTCLHRSVWRCCKYGKWKKRVMPASVVHKSVRALLVTIMRSTQCQRRALRNNNNGASVYIHSLPDFAVDVWKTCLHTGCLSAGYMCTLHKHVSENVEEAALKHRRGHTKRSYCSFLKVKVSTTLHGADVGRYHLSAIVAACWCGCVECAVCKKRNSVWVWTNGVFCGRCCMVFHSNSKCGNVSCIARRRGWAVVYGWRLQLAQAVEIIIKSHILFFFFFLGVCVCVFNHEQVLRGQGSLFMSRARIDVHESREGASLFAPSGRDILLAGV